MKVVLYNQNYENNVVDKRVAGGMILDCKLKDSCSVQNPVILINSGNISSMNYMYIEDFKRYYFITDIVCVRNELWEVHAKVDVLNSFKNGIRQNKAIILRTEDKRYSDKLFDDSLCQTTLRVDRHNKIMNFPKKGFELPSDEKTATTNIPFILVTIGTGGINIWVIFRLKI